MLATHLLLFTKCATIYFVNVAIMTCTTGENCPNSWPRWRCNEHHPPPGSIVGGLDEPNIFGDHAPMMLELVYSTDRNSLLKGWQHLRDEPLSRVKRWTSWLATPVGSASASSVASTGPTRTTRRS